MFKSTFLTFLMSACAALAGWAQEQATATAPDGKASALQLILPDKPGWNSLEEGHPLEVLLGVTGGTGSDYRFSVGSGEQKGMTLDSTGRFVWTPGYDLVDRLNVNQTVQVVFKVTNEKEESGSRTVDFKVFHTNRQPEVGELKPFYVQYNKPNVYQIDPNAVRDEDGDPIVFYPIIDQMPEGARLSSGGEFTWKPSVAQFNQVKNKPLYIEFFVEDQPAKTRSRGKFKVEATSLDLPPTVSMVPGGNSIRYPESAAINLKFYLTDPNGDDDIASFGFVSENPNVPKTALVKNTSTQYEFIWTPGYDFVRDPLDSLAFNVSFFVLDKAQKRDEIRIKFTISNAVNEVQKDLQLYTQYRTALVRAWDLIEQLKESEEKLKRDYRRARKGKKGRSVVNASLGAASGLAPVTIQTPSTAKMISTIGGTSVMTLGTLEATEVIGKSTKDLVERLNYIMDKKNELQLRGDIFARKYTLKSQRRRPEFIRDLDEFVGLMNLKGLVALELNAGWQNKNKATDSQLQKTFKDFDPDAG